MDNRLKEINERYHKIGLDQNGQPYDRPPKLYPPSQRNDYGYSGNSTVVPAYVAKAFDRGE
jgi:hypothetical protein